LPTERFLRGGRFRRGEGFSSVFTPASAVALAAASALASAEVCPCAWEGGWPWVFCLLPFFDSLGLGAVSSPALFGERVNLAIKDFNLPINFLTALLKYGPTVLDHGPLKHGSP
jgi:hypothetical protein